MAKRIIALLTDFGLKDPFVSVMKAVILGINPDVELIDLSHDVRKFDIFEAAFILYSSHKYYPNGTIFLIVVDPGVGSERKIVVVKTRRHIFIAPDNGVLYPIIMQYQKDAIIYIVDESKIEFTPKSRTFHGRDVFAPLAAYISLGYPLNYLGRKVNVNSIVKLDWYAPIIEGGKAKGQIVHIDSFGNIITSIPVKNVPWLKVGEKVLIKIEGKGEILAKFVRTFSEGKHKEFIALEDSFGLLEIALREDSAANELKVYRGLKVEVQRGKEYEY